MVTYDKQIRIPKRGGGSRLQKVKVLASGKYKFVSNEATKSKAKKSKSRKATSKTKPRKRKYKMTRRKKSRKKNFKVPLATVLGLAAGFVGPVGDAPIGWLRKGDYRSCVVRLAKSYTGYDANTGRWEPRLMASGVLPLVIGAMVSKFVGGQPPTV